MKGLYDILMEYNITFDELISMIYDLSKIVYLGSQDRVENIVRDLDDTYDDAEYQEFVENNITINR